MNEVRKKNKRKLTWNDKCRLGMLLSLVGTILFFVIPHIRIIYYSFIKNQFRKNFVGLNNYIRTITNQYFLLALKNSLLLILICVPIVVVLAIVLSIGLGHKRRMFGILKTAFVLPMLIPTASIVLVWSMLFSRLDTVMPIYILFVWKNIGICIILISSSLTGIPNELFEAASLEGIKGYRIHQYITVPLVMPTIFFTILLSIVNSFKIFKESYLYYGGNYPPDYSYTLQYYMNNNFLKLDYQALASSSILTSLFIFAIVIIGLRIQRRYDW